MRSAPHGFRFLVVLLAGWSGHAQAEPAPSLPPLPKIEPVAPEPTADYEKISLTEAVRRALARHPTAVLAAQEIERAEALLAEARAGSMPSLTLNASLLRLDADRSRNGVPIASKNQQSANLQLSVPLVAPQRWAQWSQAAANLETSKATSEDTRRSLAVATARAYLGVIWQKRLVDINARAVTTDQAHSDFTHTRFAGGVGTRVDEVRAAQQLAFDQAQLSASYAGLARAREALGVLLGEDRPVDVLDDIGLPDATFAPEDAAARRPDVRAAKQRARAAEKTRRESWTDFTPVLTGQFQPFFQHPSTFMMPETGWQAMLVLSFPLVEGGLRRGQMRERDALLAQARAQYDGLLRQARSELRVAAEAIRRADEALRSARAAAELAHQALDLANLAYAAGATTNIEVIDAERRARDADSAVVIAEDNVRQARLDLLVAAGRFP
ncbi:MAG: TolC family protein [Deltaproteobacteria bacterium]|nr:TolC family protein [Deltaproteobacteria bacterium]